MSLVHLRPNTYVYLRTSRPASAAALAPPATRHRLAASRQSSFSPIAILVNSAAPIVIASLDADRVLINLLSIRSHNGVHGFWKL